MIACTLKLAAGQNRLSIRQPHIMRTWAVMVVGVPATIDVEPAGSTNAVSRPGITITTAIAPVRVRFGITRRLHETEMRGLAIDMATKVSTVGWVKAISAMNSVASSARTG